MTYETMLCRLAETNENVVVMTAENRAAIRSLAGILGPRFIDVGICEQTMIGAAAGLALRGRTPVCHALATFLTMRAFEFIRTDIGFPALPVKLVGGIPGFLSEANGPTHQAIEDISLMRGIPNMEIFCPADEWELVRMMPAIVASRTPSYIRFNASKPAVQHTADFRIGKAEILREGNDVTILTYGAMLAEAAKATAHLIARDISVRLINLRSLKPIDQRAILRSAIETRLLVTLEDHFVTGGLYSIVAELLLRHDQPCRVLPFALEERWFKPAPLASVLTHEGFSGEQIADRILSSLPLTLSRF